jgi:transposase
MTIVMGLDQHRAQITAEWIDTDTGELGRARISPALRGDVRRFLARFAGRRLEAALEATTGWRFVADELRAAGAEVHLAEPAETAARRGNKKRAKTDRADARHLRELLMIGRLPESWIAPDHLLDLRAQVRLRHTLVDQRGEWQQRIQAVLYHHGFPQRHGLLTGENRAWLQDLDVPETAREQITVALTMIDALDAQSAPITRQLRLYARRQRGCKALMKHYGVGELTAVTILAELGDARPLLVLAPRGPLRRPGHHRPSVRPAPRPRPSLTPRTAGAALGAVRRRPGRTPPRLARSRLLRPGRRPPRRQPRLPRPRTQALETQLPHPARTRRRRPAPRLTLFGARHVLHQPDAPRPAPRIPLPPPLGGRPPKTERPQRVLREDPITHHVTDPTVVDRDKPGHSRAPHPTPPLRPQPPDQHRRARPHDQRT